MILELVQCNSVFDCVSVDHFLLLFPSPGEGVWLHLPPGPVAHHHAAAHQEIHPGGWGGGRRPQVRRSVPAACRRVLVHFTLGPVIIVGCPFNGFISLHVSLTVCVCVCLSHCVYHCAVGGWAAPMRIVSVWWAASRLSESPEFSKNCFRIFLLLFQYVQSSCFILTHVFMSLFLDLCAQPSCCNRCFACSLWTCTLVDSLNVCV